jgi:hypothetical protein
MQVGNDPLGTVRVRGVWVTLIALTVAVVGGALIGPPLLLWWLTY